MTTLLLCHLLRWHVWWLDYNFGTQKRKCLRCHRWQQLFRGRWINL